MRAEQPDSGPNPGKRRGRIGRAHSYSGSERCTPEHEGLGIRFCRISGLAARKMTHVRIADRTRKRSTKDELFVRVVE
jgi:hypothetical protein